MHTYHSTEQHDDSVILHVNSQGEALPHVFVGNFTGPAAIGAFLDLQRNPPQYPPLTFWQVPLEFDSGDASVGQPGEGYYLDHERAAPWQEAHD